MPRPASLLRLLTSLEEAHYSFPGAPPWHLHLEIRRVYSYGILYEGI